MTFMDQIYTVPHARCNQLPIVILKIFKDLKIFNYFTNGIALIHKYRIRLKLVDYQTHLLLHTDKPNSLLINKTVSDNDVFLVVFFFLLFLYHS